MSNWCKVFASIFLVFYLVLTSVVFAAEYNLPDHESALSEVQRWTCGMHPMVVSDEPGLCPICNMDLTPVVKGSSGAIIEIDPTVVQNMGVKLGKVNLGKVQRTLRLPGRVVADESREYSVTSKVGGWIETLYVSRLGQKVSKGDLLYDLYSKELESEFIDLVSASKVSKTLAVVPGLDNTAKEIMAASVHRLQRLGVSQKTIEEALISQEVPDTVPFYANQGGIVTMKMLQEGDFAASGQRIVEISDLSQLWVLIDVYESDLGSDYVGTEVELRLPGQSQVIAATVGFMYPYIDPKTRTNKLRVVIDNPFLNLKPEMFVDVKAHLDSGGPVIYVPEESIINSGDLKTVFVNLGEGRFEPRIIETGLRGEGVVEVLSGVSVGEEVVVSAQFMLDSETQLRQALNKMKGQSKKVDTEIEDLF